MSSLAAVLGLLTASVATRNRLINEAVPTPYLDEAFHIPQAQAYCRNAFSVWDPKLTTPPGLYLISYPLSYYGLCTPSALRAINAIGTALFLPLVVYRLRRTLYGQEGAAVHTAANAALFPLVYFFSGLYYTDVWSVIFVLAAYLAIAKRSPWVSAVYCWVSLWFRQTNVLWTVFIAGAWAIQRLKDAARKNQADKRVLDPLISSSPSISDFFTTPFSLLALAATYPVCLLDALTPFFLPLSSFILFLITNNFTVVLGDASAHTASLHLPQLLYFTLFTALFSFPFYLRHLASLFRPNPFLALSSLPIAAAIKFNTILHPYLLADNRHYVFYLFHKILLRLPWWAPVPVYLAAGYLQGRVMSNVSVSWTLMWALATAGTIVTAPLVEPRYFVTGWMVWRVVAVAGEDGGRKGWSKWERSAETIWLVTVNAVTTYVFLKWGFRRGWEHELGEGEVMRFMW